MGTRPMHIGLVSDHTLTHSPQQRVLHQCAEALTTRNGDDVSWLLSTDTIAALAHDPALRPADASDLPPTCRDVIPYSLYRLDTIRLIGIEPDFWQDTALHTRLFTFLCLLHREQPFAVLQAWGALSTLYLTVYTATYLHLPGTVFYTPSCLQDGPQQSFLWQWVARHTAMAFTEHATEREHLLHSSPLQPEQIRVLAPEQPDTIAALGRNFHDIAKNPFSL
ncbi:MAG: hypothetical protein ETSY2_37735 [Candidatus Entotheonella gemina]|uniref:Uncharacterized protein n=2 Tax=Candidatus Entotheonella TaxID=93171 RepID=W4LTG7_9BACT|nr:MAG: hypothetical protein ETSY2_37735 [Candidatus Entotheonella gemina]